MKKIGGKAKFNPVTKEWESQPVCYVEFHCTPTEWQKLGNGQQYLVRDWVKSHDWEKMIFQKDVPIIDVINMAVNEIICEDYEISITQTDLGYWKVVVASAPYPVYVCPWIHESLPNIFGYQIDKMDLILSILSVCKAIFNLIYSVKQYPHYLKKYQSGEYKLEVSIPCIDSIRKKESD